MTHFFSRLLARPAAPVAAPAQPVTALDKAAARLREFELQLAEEAKAAEAISAEQARVVARAERVRQAKADLIRVNADLQSAKARNEAAVAGVKAELQKVSVEEHQLLDLLNGGLERLAPNPTAPPAPPVYTAPAPAAAPAAAATAPRSGGLKISGVGAD